MDPRVRKALEEWVKQGNTVALFGAAPSFVPPLFGARARFGGSRDAVTDCGVRAGPYAVTGPFPQTFSAGCSRTRATLLRSGARAAGIAYAYGKGTVVLVTSAQPFDNEHLSKAGNARFAYDLFAPLGPVAFDERLYGYANDRSLWQVIPPPARLAIVIAGIALLLALAGANLPFAPPLTLEEKAVRDSSEYLHSLASMLRRGRAHRDAVARFCTPIKKALAPHAAQPDARAMLEEARSLEMQLSLHEEDVLAAARIFARVRKDYPC
ncbi:MAG: DUF4350 domain-containing protein, partial [Candidatus Baltobacteraceae bacterium]